MIARAVLAGALLLSVAACNTRDEPLLRPLPPASAESGAAVRRVNGPVGSPDATPPAQYSVVPAASVQTSLGTAARDTGGLSEPDAGAFTLDFADADIREVATQMLGTDLRVNFTIDPAVRGTATLRTTRPLSRGQALAALQSLLAQNGAVLLQSGGLYRVVPQAAAAAAPGIATSGNAAGGTVLPLRYVAADELAKVLQPFIGAGGRIVPDAGRNALLISGDPASRETLLNLVSAFDINLLAGQSYAVFPVGSGDAKDFATTLQDAVRGQAGGALAGVVRVLPMQRINAVLVVSSQPRYIEDVRRVFTLVERGRRATVRGWSVYYLQNSRSNDTAYVLQQAFTPRNVTALPPGSGQNGSGRGRSLSGGTGSANGSGGGGIGVSGGIGLRGGGSGGLGGIAPGGGGAPAGPAVPATPDASANPLLGGLEPSGGGGGADPAADGMRIIPNSQNNALLIYATTQERDVVEATLRRLDILPLQVRIDATIAEVTLNNELRYGTQFYFTSGEFNSVLSTAFGTVATAGLNTALPGFVFAGKAAGGVPLAITALQSITNVRVLSSPQIMVLDNEPARLQVGQLVPFLTQSAQSTLSANAPIVSSVDYRETGVIMEVTPRVNSGGLVTLDISQEVSAVDPTQTTPGLNSPTFSQRVVRTRVAVQDGQTIGLAGLIRDNVTEGNSGIPFLSRIPVLGSLFGSQDNARNRTELLVLITPRVIHDQRDARALTEDLRDQLVNAAALPSQLRTLPLPVTPDPSGRARRRLGLE